MTAAFHSLASCRPLIPDDRIVRALAAVARAGIEGENLGWWPA